MIETAIILAILFCLLCIALIIRPKRRDKKNIALANLAKLYERHRNRDR